MSGKQCRWGINYETIVVAQEKYDGGLNQCPEQKRMDGKLFVVRVDRNFLSRSKREGKLTDSTFLALTIFISKMKYLD